MSLNYKDLTKSIKATQANIRELQELIDLCDSREELANLAVELQYYENQLANYENRVENTIYKGQ